MTLFFWLLCIPEGQVAPRGGTWAPGDRFWHSKGQARRSSVQAAYCAARRPNQSSTTLGATGGLGVRRSRRRAVVVGELSCQTQGLEHLLPQQESSPRASQSSPTPEPWTGAGLACHTAGSPPESCPSSLDPVSLEAECELVRSPSAPQARGIQRCTRRGSMKRTCVVPLCCSVYSVLRANPNVPQTYTSHLSQSPKIWLVCPKTSLNGSAKKKRHVRPAGRLPDGNYRMLGNCLSGFSFQVEPPQQKKRTPTQRRSNARTQIVEIRSKLCRHVGRSQPRPNLSWSNPQPRSGRTKPEVSLEEVLRRCLEALGFESSRSHMLFARRSRAPVGDGSCAPRAPAGTRTGRGRIGLSIGHPLGRPFGRSAGQSVGRSPCRVGPPNKCKREASEQTLMHNIRL